MLLLLTQGALLVAAYGLTARLVPSHPRLERAAATTALGPALAIGVVYALSPLRAIAQVPFAVASLGVTAAIVAVTRREARLLLDDDLRALRQAVTELRREPFGLAGLGVGALSLALAASATWVLEPWAWDSLGYHLPIVHDALQTGTLRHVPTHVHYVNVYPRLIDVYFLAWRLGLDGDTWIELAQLPFAVTGVLSLAALATRGGGAPARAVGLAALWLAIPVLSLELAAVYVDVAVAGLALVTFTLATSSLGLGASVLTGAVAGLLLGSKPSSPPMVAIALLTLAIRSHRAGSLGAGLVGGAVALLVGSGKFVENLLVHQNPIWPARVDLGPIELFAGRVSMRELASNGLSEPALSEGWFGRVVRSWTSWPDVYIYDMRMGGFGPLFTLGLLPLTIAIVIALLRSSTLRARVALVALPLALVLGTTLASPGAYWARYTLAVPGALLVLALVALETLPRGPRGLAHGALVLLGATGTWFALGGFTDGERSLLELARMPEDERRVVHAVDDQEAQWHDARSRVQPGEAFGYDRSLALPGRIWRSDGRGRVEYLAEPPTDAEALAAWADEHRARVLALDEREGGAAALARAAPHAFRELFRSAYPAWQPGAVFERIEER